jgi:hypothetical protein
MNYKLLSIIFGLSTLILGVGFIYSIWFVDPEVESSVIITYDPNAPASVTPAPLETPTPTPFVPQPWKLAKGDPADTCTSPTFTGLAKVKGWYVWDYNYIEKAWLIKINQTDLSNLPINKFPLELQANYRKDPLFVLNEPSKELEDQLKQAGEDNPVDITVTGFNQYCEGRANLTIQES